VTILLIFPLQSNSNGSGDLTEPRPFKSGSAINFSYLSHFLETKAAPANGKAPLHFVAYDPELSIDGSAQMPAQWGLNTITATGINPAGASNTATYIVDLESPTTPPSNTGSVGTIGLAGSTGSSNPGSTTGTPGSIGLAFTGANLIALILASMVLLLLGGSVVIYTRRRGMERQYEMAGGNAPRPYVPVVIADLPESGWHVDNIW
jgi:hypothetical protein